MNNSAPQVHRSELSAQQKGSGMFPLMPNKTNRSCLQELEQDFCAGKFKKIEKELELFITQHKKEINLFRDTELKKIKNTPVSDELAIKLFIMRTRSINPIEEIKLELQEIEKEIWYRGEKANGQVDRDKICQEWCQSHAAGWRDHWVMSVLYVFERHKNKFVKLLK
ncbi:MAG: hypothetical protein KAI63_05280 [Planctomycetes bacterium]|nr:hypothetical protein [Planctomycetota bacterium]